MVIKAAQMRIPFLVSRSGLTQMGYEIAQKVGMTMIGRATNRHYLLFTGAARFRADQCSRCAPKGRRQPRIARRAGAPAGVPAASARAGPMNRHAITGLVLAGGQGR